MAVFDNMNYSYSQGVAPGVVDYYERALLENAKPEMVHARDSQKRTLPENNGKRIQFRRMTPFGVMTTPLTEGVTPDGQTLSQTQIWAMVKPYGAHVEMTDELDLYHLDNLHQETSKLLSDQAALSLDTICRDAINGGMNVQYANSKSSRGALTAADKLTADEVKKAVRTLKRNNCKPFADGYYHAIVHPDSVYDLTSDPQWIDVAKYQDKSKIEKYELGCVYKVKFFESTNAKTFGTETYLYDNVTQLVAGANWDAGKKMMTLSTALTADAVRKLAGKVCNVSANSTLYPMCVDRIEEGKYVYFRWQPASTTAWTTANSLKIVPMGGGNGVDVFSTVIYGANAFGTVELGGNGKNVRVIIKAPGSSGAIDPLDQRGTIAWKVKGFCCTVLQDAFIVRVEHGATA